MDTRVLPSLSNDDHAWSNLLPYAFVWEKPKTIDFSEPVVVYDIKICRCCQLNDYINLYEYQMIKVIQ